MKSINGIPIVGFGTFPLQGEEANRAVRMAIDAGYRHIDTAQMYGNEAAVGRALRDCGLPRRELFVVTKVDPGNIGASRFMPSVERSLDDLGGEVDLLLIHWPPAAIELDAAVDRLMDAQSRGMTRRIGVSNFSPNMLRRAHDHSGGLIVCNQVEFHPLLDQRALVAEAARLGVALTAYSPLARGAALKPDAVQSIARRLERPPSEIVLRWIIQQDVVAIPMTTKPENAGSNLRALDFVLTAEDMAAISSLGTKAGRLINPSWMAGRWDE